MLGCLVEKQLTTPQQYPLTLNALTLAANQATNRDPVVTLEDDSVLVALDELRSQHLIRVVLPSHGRSVKRYRHVLDEVFGLDAPRYALVAILLLRGPQTVGELRGRTERMVDFPSVGDVHEQLAVLADHSVGLARLQPRRPGQKEDRWQQILAAPWGPDGASDGGAEGHRLEPDAIDGAVSGDGTESTSATDSGPAQHQDELEAVRTDLASLRTEVVTLRSDLDALRQGLGG